MSARKLINKLDLTALLGALSPRVHEVRVYGDERDDDLLDKMDSAYQAERARWGYRRNIVTGNYRFELVRNSSPNNDINADEYFEIITLTKRECSDRHEAEGWLRTFAGRAAMRAALKAVAT